MRFLIPRSLIAQLSLAYGAAFLAMLVFFGIATILLTSGLASTLRGHLQAVDRRIPDVVKLYTQAPNTLLKSAPAIVGALHEPGVVIIVIDHRSHTAYIGGRYQHVDFGPHGGPDRATEPHFPGARALTIPPDDHGPPSGHFPLPVELFIVSAILGIFPIEHHLSGGSILIWPDARLLGTPFITYIGSLVLLALGAFTVAGIIGRSLSVRAIAPLFEVTKALRVIAEGDFRTHEIHFSQRSEIGALAEAYNQAVTRVELAFHERDLLEQRMRQFIADAGHEIRTPLTVILGYIDILAREAAKNGTAQAGIFKTINAEGQRMRSLVNNLILLMRLEQENQRQPRVIDLTALVFDIVDALRPLDPQCRLQTVFRAEARVLGDIDELREAISNLVDNALKYAPASPVVLTVDHDEQTAWIDIDDEGDGIATDEQAFIFNRFYRGAASENIEGSGLGLAIARRAVERSAGTITLRSAPGAGTHFRLSFPVHHAAKMRQTLESHV